MFGLEASPLMATRVQVVLRARPCATRLSGYYTSVAGSRAPAARRRISG